MVALKSLALGFLAAFANDANAAVMQESVDSGMRVLSTAEIMATMTHEHALSLVLNNKQLKTNPQLTAVLKDLQEGNVTTVTKARVEQEVRFHVQDPKPKGYAAVAGARNMLNDMLDDVSAKLDNEEETCGTYNRVTLVELESIRQDVASFNGLAAQARGQVLQAQSVIAFVNVKLPQVEEELENHRSECILEESGLNSQIEIVEADLNVMGSISEIIGDCGKSSAAGLIQCRHCRKSGEGYVMLQDDSLQPLLDKLKSADARKVVQQSLGELYDESAEKVEPVALTQLQVGTLRGGRQEPHDEEFMASMGNDSAALNISEVPEETTPVDCMPTNKCTLGKGSCEKIRDRFLYIGAGIQDMLEQLKDDLAELQKTCEENRLVMEAQIANLGENLRGSQTDLAVSTQRQVESESSSNLKGQQHGEVTQEFGRMMNECCNELNNLKSEKCALAKIRGELFRLKGVDAFITDCEVSDFKATKCSVSCDGGVLTKARSILVHPVDGMACPPLEMKESCNTHHCPVDCIVGDWQDWSGCSANCGGGLRERMRNIETQMKYGGQPCEDTEEVEACNSQSCNADCQFAPWSAWGKCSQVCWGGKQRRERSVAEQARGTGTCSDPDADARLEFRTCNKIPCNKFYHKEHGRRWLKCGSKTDIIILVDGSGSLGRYGWKKVTALVTNMLRHLKGGDDFVKVSVQLFSGPTSGKALRRCTGASTTPPNMVKDCGIEWVTHFTNDTMAAAEKVEKLQFPRKTTLTSVALAEAQAELIQGREDASSIVIVVTDGKPLSQSRTKQAAHSLMQHARVIWVPVGRNAPIKLIKQLASLPKNENIVRMKSFRQLAWPYFMNQIMVKACPVLA